MIRRSLALGFLLALCLASCGGSSSAPPVGSTSTTAATPPAIPTTSAWLAYWDTGVGLNSFQQYASQFKELHPFWYDAKSATSISFEATTAQQTAVMSAASGARVLVVPTVTESMKTQAFQAMVADNTQRSTHAQALCNLAVQNNFDGLDLDYEQFAVSPTATNIPILANLFVELAQQTASCLHAQHKRLEVTVMARTDDAAFATYRPTLAIGVYDYTALGQAADVVRPMAYDYHYPGGPAGSIDPIDWVTQVAAYATHHVPANKTELALPLYGQDWSGTGAEVVTAASASDLAAKNQASPQLDAATGSMTFDYAANGKTHHVWWDDTAATRARVAIAQKYAMSGVSFWMLGDESSDFWS